MIKVQIGHWDIGTIDENTWAAFERNGSKVRMYYNPTPASMARLGRVLLSYAPRFEKKAIRTSRAAHFIYTLE